MCCDSPLFYLKASKLSILWEGMGEVVPARTSPTLHPHPLPLGCDSSHLLKGIKERELP